MEQLNGSKLLEPVGLHSAKVLADIVLISLFILPTVYVELVMRNAGLEELEINLIWKKLQ